jgi:FixJ family two-component response regulator
VEQHPPPAGSGGWVVVVDDDLALLAALRFALEAEGLRVAAFADAESALVGAPGQLSCFVLDHRLPGMSGLDLLEQLRSRGETAPAVLVTTNPAMATRSRARAAGVEIVEKPLLGNVLTRKVFSLLASCSGPN